MFSSPPPYHPTFATSWKVNSQNVNASGRRQFWKAGKPVKTTSVTKRERGRERGRKREWGESEWERQSMNQRVSNLFFYWETERGDGQEVKSLNTKTHQIASSLYLELPGSPCGGGPCHRQQTGPVGSWQLEWQPGGSGSQTESHSHGSLWSTTAGSRFHCLKIFEKEIKY